MIRVALIGAGSQGSALARTMVDELANVASLTVVCDVDEAAARGVGAGDHCTDYRLAIDRDDVDAVFIVVPPGLHREITVFAADCGKHVFCEKPMAVSVKDGQEILATCDAARVMLMIGYPFRYGENRETLHNWLQEGRIGRPVMWRETLPLYAEGQRWLPDPVLGGGAIYEYSHSIDFACYTFGKPVSTYAQLFTFAQGDGRIAHDSFTCVIRFESGDLYQISGFGMLPMFRDASQAFGGSHRYRENDVVGPRGAIYTGTREDGTTGMVLSENVGSTSQKLTHHPWTGWSGFASKPPLAMLQDFFYGIRTGNYDTRNNGQQGLQTLRVLAACVESSRSGHAVTLNPGPLPHPYVE